MKTLNNTPRHRKTDLSSGSEREPEYMKLCKLGHWLRAAIGKIDRSRCPIFPSSWKLMYKKKPYPQRLMPVLWARVGALEPGDTRSDRKRNWDGVHMVRNISGISSSRGSDATLPWHYSTLRLWIRCRESLSHDAVSGLGGNKSIRVLRMPSGFTSRPCIYDRLSKTQQTGVWIL